MDATPSSRRAAWLHRGPLVPVVALAAVAWLLAPALSASPEAPAGAVSGTVRLDAPADPPPPMLSPYARPRYRPPAERDGAAGSARDVVVYLVPSSAPLPRTAPAPVAIVQRDRTILPHVTPVQRGGRVDFPNEDDVYHNLFSLSRPNAFNLGRYPPGSSRSEVFEDAGVVRMFCDIHSEMGGVILVLDTPWFARPGPDGRYRIPGLPPGEYTAVAWHDAAGADSVRVVVRDGAEATVDFALGR